VIREEGKYENKIDRKNMIPLTRQHTERSRASILGASFFRELCWFFQRGDHVLDLGMIVFSAQQDRVKVEALRKLNANPQLAASTTLMLIVVDHGQERLRAHEHLWQAVVNRPPWMLSEDIVEAMDVYEMDMYVSRGALPFRFQTVRQSLRTEMSEPFGTACVMDLGACAERSASRTSVELFQTQRYSVTNLVYEFGNAFDGRGDLALAYLAHLLKSLPLPDVDGPTSFDVSSMKVGARHPGLFGELTFKTAISIPDLMLNASPEYHQVAHEHFLRDVPSDAPFAAVQQRLVSCLRLREYVELHNGSYHGVISSERLAATVMETKNNAAPNYEDLKLHCAVAYAQEAAAAGSTQDTRFHHYAVVWQTWQARVVD